MPTQLQLLSAEAQAQQLSPSQDSARLGGRWLGCVVKTNNNKAPALLQNV